MKKKIAIHDLTVTDLALDHHADHLDVLKCSLARPRRVCRNAITKALAAAGFVYPPNPETWRHVAAANPASRPQRRRLRGWPLISHPCPGTSSPGALELPMSRPHVETKNA